jgi:2-oxoglutarate ferredoxin oxidoreductase subunit alpha
VTGDSSSGNGAPGASNGASVETKDRVSIRFCGDSGDGMQLTGGQFTNTSAVFGNDFATFPDFPAEIRAPKGTTFGVSGFQVQFSKDEIFTPGEGQRPGRDEPRRLQDQH